MGRSAGLSGGKRASFAGMQFQWLAGGPWDIVFSLWASVSSLEQREGGGSAGLQL